MTNADFAEDIRQKIWDNRTFTNYKHYGDFYHNASHEGTSHLSVIAENGDAVSATTTSTTLCNNYTSYHFAYLKFISFFSVIYLVVCNMCNGQ